jgi:hypothetical protein
MYVHINYFFLQEICLNFEDENLSEKFSAKMESHKIDTSSSGVSLLLTVSPPPLQKTETG